jgi:hypothetical protein
VETAAAASRAQAGAIEAARLTESLDMEFKVMEAEYLQKREVAAARP